MSDGTFEAEDNALEAALLDCLPRVLDGELSGWQRFAGHLVGIDAETCAPRGPLAKWVSVSSPRSAWDDDDTHDVIVRVLEKLRANDSFVLRRWADRRFRRRALTRLAPCAPVVRSRRTRLVGYLFVLAKNATLDAIAAKLATLDPVERGWSMLCTLHESAVGIVGPAPVTRHDLALKLAEIARGRLSEPQQRALRAYLEQASTRTNWKDVAAVCEMTPRDAERYVRSALERLRGAKPDLDPHV